MKSGPAEASSGAFGREKLELLFQVSERALWPTFGSAFMTIRSSDSEGFWPISYRPVRSSNWSTETHFIKRPSEELVILAIKIAKS